MTGVEILTPIGRLVQGSPWEGRTTDQQGNQLTSRNGQPITRYFMALAIPKTDATYGALYQIIQQEGARGWPQHHALPTFSWKIVDGDSTVPDANGRAPVSKEGFAKHWVLKFSSTFAPKCFDTAAQPLTDPESIKTGYYIRIAGSVAANDSQQKPGVYLNPSAIQLCGYGPEIVSGPDGSVFSAQPVIALPTGASATPIAPAVAPPVAPAVPAAPAPAVPAAPGAPAPAPDFLNPPAPPAPPAPMAERRYRYGAATYTESQLRAAGWTENAIQALPVV